MDRHWTKQPRLDNAVSIYLQDISREIPLRPGEEEALTKRIAEGDPEARDRLLRTNLKFVVRTAKDIHALGESTCTLSDLIEAGNLGAIRAAELYDGSVPFRKFARHWARQAMYDEVTKHRHSIVPKLFYRKALRKFKEAERTVSEKLNNRKPEIEEIVNHFKGRGPKFLSTMRSIGTMESIEILSVDDIEHCDRLPEPHEVAEKAERSALIEKALNRLDPRAAQIVRMKFGMPPFTMEAGWVEIARTFGITKERARQLYEGAKRSLKRTLAIYE